MNRLLIILGPTATGKTDLALSLAKLLNGELISADSRQVYTGLDIGTGKLPGKDVVFEKHDRYWIVDGVRVWLYDVIEPAFQYDVWQYVRDAKEIIEQITSEGKLPIIVGGTGLYIQGLLEGFSEMEIPADFALREELENMSVADIQAKLSELDNVQFRTLNNSELHNKRRLIRRVEKLLLKNDFASHDSPGIGAEFHILKVGLTTERKVLYKRIDERVIKRVGAGMIEEAKHVHESGLSLVRMRSLGLEYRSLADYLEGKFKTKEEFEKSLQFKIHQFAKRQLTWFSRDKNIEWFDICDDDFKQKVEERVLNWYNV